MNINQVPISEFETYDSSLIVIRRDDLVGLLESSTNVSDAIKKLDEILVPSSSEVTGLMSAVDKIKLDNIQDDIESTAFMTNLIFGA